MPAPSDFRWIAWNIEKVQKHGVSPAEAERAVRNARRPYPRRMDRSKWLVEGRGQASRMLRVIYLIDADGTAFVIHAMPITLRRRQ